MAKKSKPVQKQAPKKAVAKKVVAKKAVAKKAVKKQVVKKNAAKKVATAKTVTKKNAIKKIIPQKPVAKKAIAKKAVVKKSLAKPVSPAVKKKPVAKKVVKPTAKPVATALPAELAQPDTLVEKAANIQHEQMMVPGDGLNESQEQSADPLTSFDQHAFNKATSKGDPQSKIRLSSVPKNSIKPSGKKPLWRK